MKAARSRNNQMFANYSSAALSNKVAKSSSVKKINSTLQPAKSTLVQKPVIKLDLE